MEIDFIRPASGFFDFSSWVQDLSGIWMLTESATRVEDFGGGERERGKPEEIWLWS